MRERGKIWDGAGVGLSDGILRVCQLGSSCKSVTSIIVSLGPDGESFLDFLLV